MASLALSCATTWATAWGSVARCVRTNVAVAVATRCAAVAVAPTLRCLARGAVLRGETGSGGKRYLSLDSSLCRRLGRSRDLGSMGRPWPAMMVVSSARERTRNHAIWWVVMMEEAEFQHSVPAG